MPRRYRILLRKQAAADLQGIFDHIAADSLQNAPRVIHRILDAIESLASFPHRTVVAGQSRKAKRPVRSLPIQSDRVLYVVDEHEVVRVLRVRHGAQRRLRRYD